METEITRLRNLMTPMVNYFAMFKDFAEMAKVCDNIRETDGLFKIVEDERRKANENMPEVLDIIKSIPDSACNGNQDNSKLANCAIFDVSELLPDLEIVKEANQKYAGEKGGGDYGFALRCHRDGVNWALNYIVQKHKGNIR